LPVFDLGAPANQKELRDSLARFGQGWSAYHEREERRLAYVAVTRPRHLLLCSGFWWAEGGVRARGPSTFLEDVRDVCLDGAGSVDVWTPRPAEGVTNPTLEAVVSAADLPRASPIRRWRPW
jgi:DNA helicase-2/ATP-dependent DNA helicase PcrA